MEKAHNFGLGSHAIRFAMELGFEHVEAVLQFAEPGQDVVIDIPSPHDRESHAPLSQRQHRESLPVCPAMQQPPLPAATLRGTAEGEVWKVSMDRKNADRD